MRLRKRFWAETVLGLAAGLLAVVTLLWEDWIETLFGESPDNGSGATEWSIVVGLAVIAVVCALLARQEYAASRVPEA